MEEKVNMWTYGKTVGDLVKDLRLEEDGSFDYAMPQPWCEEFERITGEWPIGQFVWYYDKGHSVFGRPYPLTDNARWLLSKYNKQANTDYPLR